MAEERLGASFSIDVSQLQAGLKTANRLIRESQAEFKKAAAGLDDWQTSEEGLTARNKMLTSQIEIQREKVKKLTEAYQNELANGLDETSDRAIFLRTQIKNEEAALIRNEEEVKKNTKAMAELGDESEEAGKDAEKASDGFTVMKGVLANLATQGINMALNGLKSLGSAFINVGKQAIESYADYEQLVGGVETLFGAGGQSIEEYAKSVGKSVKDVETEYNNLMTAQDTMITNANNAYKTSGMSANEYMQNVTGFSAALISSLDGDTVKAASAADRAMTDISDNANKMGTDMQSIVDTYQSLARGNYQMLDNLKLGYGGTKSEMERMIADANAVKKANGEMANLSIDSFADITEAIHIIQDEMGITGTTAKEASTTIQGSIGMMKSSWQNLLTGMADDTMDFDQLITNFIDSVEAVAKNLIPRITIVMQGIIKLIQGLLPQIPPLLQEILPQLVTGIVDMANSLAKILPDVVNILVNDVLPLLLSALIGLLPTLLTTCITMVTQIINALTEMLPTIVDAIIEVVPLLVTALVDAIPELLEAAITLLMAIVQAIPQILPQLQKMTPEIIKAIVGVLINNLPTILTAAVQLLTEIVKAIPVIIPVLVKQLPTVVKAIFDALTSQQAIDNIKLAGTQLIQGLWQGISDMAGWIGEKIKGFGEGVLNSLKSFFGIHSPSKVMEKEIGQNIAKGIGKGIEDGENDVVKITNDFSEHILTAFSGNLNDYKTAGNELVKTYESGISGAIKTTENNVKNIIDIYFDDLLAENKKQQTKLKAEQEKQLESLMTENANKEKQLQDQIDGTKDKTRKAKLKKELDEIKSANKEKVREQKAANKAELDELKNQNAELKNLYNDFAKTAIAEFNAVMEAEAKGISDELSANISSLSDAMEKEISAVESKIETMRSKLADYGDLFTTATDEATGKEIVSLENINAQTKALKQYEKNLKALEEYAGSEDLINEITQMSVEDALKYSNALLSQDENYIYDYLEAYNKKQQQAKKISKKFYADQIADIKSEYTWKMEAEFADAQTKLSNLGEQTMKGFIKGMSSKSFNKEIQKIAKNIVKQMKTALGIHSPSKVFADQIGKNAALGIVKGFEQNITDLSATMMNATGNISAAVSGGAQAAGMQSKNVVVYQTNNYSQAHSRYEIYKSKQQTAAAVRLALGSV